MSAHMHLRRSVAVPQRFDLERRPVRRWFAVQPATDDDIPDLVSIASRHLPGISVDREAILAVHRKCKSILSVKGPDGLAGLTAFLPLNAQGYALFKTGLFDIARPDTCLLSAPMERAQAVYTWALCVPGATVSAMGQVMDWMRRPSYAGCDIYACPGSPAGERFMIKIGFEITAQTLNGAPLWVYRRPNPLIASGVTTQ